MSPLGKKGVTRAQIDPGTSGFISFLLDALRDVENLNDVVVFAPGDVIFDDGDEIWDL